MTTIEAIDDATRGREQARRRFKAEHDKHLVWQVEAQEAASLDRVFVEENIGPVIKQAIEAARRMRHGMPVAEMMKAPGIKGLLSGVGSPFFTELQTRMAFAQVKNAVSQAERLDHQGKSEADRLTEQEIGDRAQAAWAKMTVDERKAALVAVGAWRED